MADFEQAHLCTAAHEGYPGWVCDPNDPGGETVAGISRRANPTFAGWATVDKVRKALGWTACAKTINAALKAEPDLPALVKAYYRKVYWTPLNLDAEPNQRLANSVYDFAVNAGPKPSLAALHDAYERAREALAAGGLADVD